MSSSWRLPNRSQNVPQSRGAASDSGSTNETAPPSDATETTATNASSNVNARGLPSPSFHFDREGSGAQIVATTNQAPPVAIADLPRPLQTLANELDAVWGNGDGEVSVGELNRVAKYVLAALPFFTKEASAILELADALGFTKEPQTNATLNSIRQGLGELDTTDVADGDHYRTYLDAAIAESDASGSPDLIRSFAAHNPRYHRLSILEHTAAAVLSIRTLANVAGVDWKEAGAVMLLHDVGKILNRTIRAPWERFRSDEKNWHFSGHEAMGADWLKSRGLHSDLVTHVRIHGDLREMAPRSFKTLLGSDKTMLKQFFLVSLADLLAKGDSPSLVASAAGTKPRFEKLATAAGLDFPKLWGAYEAHRSQWFGSGTVT